MPTENLVEAALEAADTVTSTARNGRAESELHPIEILAAEVRQLRRLVEAIL